MLKPLLPECMGSGGIVFNRFYALLVEPAIGQLGSDQGFQNRKKIKIHG